MKRCVWFVLLAAVSGFAQSYKTCDVTMWANEEPHSRSSHSNILYFIRMGKGNYQIERPGPNVEMNAGQRMSCRIDKGYMFLRDNQGRINKAQIVESGQLQNQH